MHSTQPNQATRIACVGDSITFGAGITQRFRNNYPAQLATRLGSGYKVKNFGVNSTTMLKKGDFPYWETKQFQSAHDYQPDLVIIKLGTNDSKPNNWKHAAEFASDYLEMIKSFRALPSKPGVWLCYPIPAAHPGNFGITDAVIKDGVIPQIDKVANQTEAKIVDLYGALDEHRDLLPDNVHPNSAGAKIIAETICAAVISD